MRRAPFGPGAQIGAQFGATPLSARLARPPRRYRKHQDDIITGAFSSGMMADWDNDDANLLKWRAATAETGFEKTPAGSQDISEQEYFDNGVLMVAMVKAGVELASDIGVARRHVPVVLSRWGAGRGPDAKSVRAASSDGPHDPSRAGSVQVLSSSASAATSLIRAWS